ncbi:Conserved hypothetical protein CHP01589, plant [Dillenia turbinata]|uniref:Uncharacterized protein n=1 Tax=Dillenia turbinata TaxID=194707 RepID=A0AAN8ZCT6_9MAGN
MSAGEVRRVSRQDIQLVQNLIERCLQLYMNQKEVVETLLVRAKIEPGFTELVWQKLEEENREFFKAYHLRLMVKNQIMVFNKLLETQVELMHEMHSTGVDSVPVSNGSHISSLCSNSACFGQDHTGSTLKQESMQPAINSSLPNAYSNGGPSLHTNVHNTVDMSAHARRIDVPPNLLPTQCLNTGMIQGMNGGIIKLEPVYSSGSSFMFGGDTNVSEARQTIGDASIVPYNGVESNSDSLNDPLLDPDASAFGFLGQIPRNFSLSDLTAEFSQSSGYILESYPRSPFLAADTDNFLDPRERGEYHGENKRLDTISESYSIDEFGSE